MSKIISVLICVITLSGCYYDNEEELYPSLSNSCDTTNVTFTKNIAPIMTQYCNGCHGSGAAGGYQFTSYNLVKTSVDVIIGSIDHQSGFSPMPKDGNKLDDCKIRAVKIWKQTNMPN